MDINEIVITGAIGLTFVVSAGYSTYIIGYNKGVSDTQKIVNKWVDHAIKEIDTDKGEINFK